MNDIAAALEAEDMENQTLHENEDRAFVGLLIVTMYHISVGVLMESSALDEQTHINKIVSIIISILGKFILPYYIILAIILLLLFPRDIFTFVFADHRKNLIMIFFLETFIQLQIVRNGEDITANETNLEKLGSRTSRT